MPIQALEGPARNLILQTVQDVLDEDDQKDQEHRGNINAS
jgi:hypothetical protein